MAHSAATASVLLALLSVLATMSGLAGPGATGSVPSTPTPVAPALDGPAIALATAASSLQGGNGPAHGESVACAYSSPGAMHCTATAANSPAPPMASGTAPGWTQVTSTSSPNARTFAAMTYDPAIKAVLLFGGYHVAVYGTNDTWIFSNGSWTNLSSTLPRAPSPRWSASLAYDAYDGYAVLFGGRDMGSFYNDSWEFNGTAWVALTINHAPSPRASAAMTYDAKDQYLLLVGGYDSTAGRLFNDTWSYRSGNWTNLTSASGPSPGLLPQGALAYDARDNYAVYFSGASVLGCTHFQPTTWTYSSGHWANLTASLPASPPGRGGALTYDPYARAVVLFSGQSQFGGACNTINDTWVFQNGTWTNITSYFTVGPIGRCCDGFAGAPTLNGSLLFGGNGAANNPTPSYLGDTWTFRLGPGLRASLQATPTMGRSPLTVHATVSPALGVAPYSENWSFGDGSPNATTSSINHTYMSGGVYSLAVTVQDSNGSRVTLTTLVRVVTGSWTDLTGWSNPPSGRAQAALVYDPTSSGVLLFGGLATGGYALGDTWLFTDGNWTDLTSNLATSPAARWGTSLTYDSVDGYVLLFGGHSGAVNFNDTWTYTSNAGWVNVTSSIAPSPRAYSQLFTDTTDGYVVLFGGVCMYCALGSNKVYNDTWEYRGGAWTLLAPKGSVAPPKLVFDGGAYDAFDQMGVIFGGATVQCTGANLTWTYSAGRWANATTSSGSHPISSSEGEMTYDPQLHGVVLFGGYYPSANGCEASNWTYVFGGGKWANVTLNYSNAPAGRCCVGMAYDDANGVLVTFGGNGGTGYTGGYMADTWSLPNAPMDLRATATPVSGDYPVAVNLSVSPRGGVGPYTALWVFGDGSPNATNLSVVHTYRSTGTFVPVVVVTDARGQWGEVGLNVTVSPVLAVSASVGSSAIELPNSTSFHSTVTGGRSPYSYDWSFGDGSSSSSADPAHAYASPGNYTATLTVRDANGGSNVSRVNVSVFAELTLAVTVTPRTGDAPLLVEGQAIVSGGAGGYAETWSFGDGTANVSGNSTGHVFSAPGIFLLGVRAVDALGYVATHVVQIVVNADPVVNLTGSPTEGIAPLPVEFTAASSGGTLPFNETWSFGDGNVSYGASVVAHTYTSPGNYTVHFSLVDADGSVAHATTLVVVGDPLGVTPAGSGSEGPAPYQVNFTSGQRGGIAPYNYTWNFGDGSRDVYVPDPSHVFSALGTHRVTVRVVDAIGDVANGAMTISVVERLGVSLSASLDPVSIGTNVTIQAIARGGAAPIHYHWSGLPPGCLTLDGPIVTCAFPSAGNTSVSVTVDDALNESATAQVEINVTPAPSSPTAATSSPFGAFPGGTIGVVATVVAVAAASIAGLVLWRRRGPPSADEETAEGETYDEDDPVAAESGPATDPP